MNKTEALTRALFVMMIKCEEEDFNKKSGAKESLYRVFWSRYQEKNLLPELIVRIVESKKD
jgi:hypothetical protein